MEEIFWKCPVCGFFTDSEVEKQRHLEESINDREHFNAIAEEIENEEWYLM